VICDGGTNLDIYALHVGDDDNILDVGHLDTGGRCSSGGNGTLAAGKSGGPDYIAIHDLLAPGAFTTTAPPLYTHKESRWSKMLLSFSESRWGATR
jgi:hypothetical protein